MRDKSKKKKTLDEMGLFELKQRWAIANNNVKTLEAVADKEPNKAEALRYYRTQLAQIELAIARKNPIKQNVVIGLKTAHLQAKTNPIETKTKE